MKILDPGHMFALETLDGKGEYIALTFVKRQGLHYPGNVGSHAGTTSQEVVRALLARARYVQAQIPCLETEMVIGLLEQVIALHEIRAKRVKDKHLFGTLAHVVGATPCKFCGHVDCTEGHR